MAPCVLLNDVKMRVCGKLSLDQHNNKNKAGVGRAGSCCIRSVTSLCRAGQSLPHSPLGEERAGGAGPAGGVVHQLLRLRDARPAALRPVHAPLRRLLPAGRAGGSHPGPAQCLIDLHSLSSCQQLPQGTAAKIPISL